MFVIMDIDDGLTLSAAIDCLRAAGRAMYWSRLPALVLLPAGLADGESALRDSGVISPCVAKPFEMKDIVNYIRRSQAR